MIVKETYIVLGDLGRCILFESCFDSKILTITNVSAGMYRVLSNIQDGAASLDYYLWNCG